MSAGPTTKGALRHVLGHLLTPLLMCVGMGLAYLGAFHAPAPHDLRVDIVGSGPHAQVLAQTLQDKTAGALDVRTVPDRATATAHLRDRSSFGAYLPGGGQAASGATGARHVADGTTGGGPAADASPGPELLVASASSDTSAMAAEKVFTKVAATQGEPLKVTDVAPVSPGDPTGQGVFFLLVALSIGSYASVAVIGGAGAVLPMRIRALLAAGTSLVVSLIGAVFAGPLFHLVDRGLGGVWALAWLYCAGILLVGVGLHTYLKRWTTLGVMVLFVMLNFTSSGGIYRPELQPGFFGSLHAFWNGAGFVEGVRGHVYFDGQGLGRNVLVLALWFLAGAVLTVAAGRTEGRRAAAAAPVASRASAVSAAGARGRSEQGAKAQIEEDIEEEIEEAVGV
ncbi:membrane protein [Streptomyces showdoensis]|uniref:Membrane protein n=1 Tax=Streptomyces showdoensis TaxID=68268 RepID=A0A2P2GMF9_STREW|nr:membrane protein [Streptomyces showdoensis]